MAVLRASVLVTVLVGFLLVGAPLQWLALRSRRLPRAILPVLFCRTACAVLGLRVMVRGTCAQDDGGPPTLLVPNHVSWADILVLGCSRELCFLAKKEVAGWPLLGLFAKVQGAVFVDRSRRMAIPAVNEAIARRLAQGRPVVLFAEATTGDGTRLMRFHSSHFDALDRAATLTAAQPVVQPVAILYNARRGLPLGRAGRADVAWYGETGFLPHLWWLLRSGGIGCEIVYGEPIPAERLPGRRLDRKALARRARAGVAGLRDVRFPDGVPAKTPPVPQAAHSPVLLIEESA